MRGPDLIKSHQKRLQNIKKKSFELSTLCGVDVCVISFSADGRKVDTWPENSNEVKAILNRYKEHQSGHQSKLNKCDIGASEQFQRDTCLSSTTDDILPLLNKLSSNSLKSFSEQITDKIERISKRIELLKCQSLQPSLFFVDEVDCSINQSNPNIDLDNGWWSSPVDMEAVLPGEEQCPNIVLDNGWWSSPVDMESVGHQFNSNSLDENMTPYSPLMSSNLLEEHNEIPNKDMTLMSYEGASDGVSSLFLSNGIQSVGSNSHRLPGLDDHLGSFGGPNLQQLCGLNELLSMNKRLDLTR